jgi:hypothetical protein
VGLLDEEGEEGLVCLAEAGLLSTASGIWGLSCSHSSTSPGDIGTGSCLSKGMGIGLGTGDGLHGIGGSCM